MNILETERLQIRQLSREDAPFILQLVNEPSFIQNIGDRGVRTLADAEKYIENGPVASYARNGFGLCLVTLKESGESIGMCGLIKREALEDVDIGYAFLPQFWSKGYAFEAAQAFKQYAREVVGLTRLVAIVDPTNQGSIRVLEKLGMAFEKMVRLSSEDIDLKLFAVQV
ncbi:MAG TPA: GNAT family N-acetyltransferase [Anaerolineales bacterium]|nr:GNAT family N-acetyltransferase [Anaerolineales bacterium]